MDRIVMTESRAMTGVIQGRKHLEDARHEIDVARQILQQLDGSEEDAHRLTEILAQIRETADLLSRSTLGAMRDSRR